ncbi:hypothetical protein DXG03_001350 [Asterophora parasitica]|uniref:Uncharacterized protein n=1 Tax=Asterophora parasitica TaxID=117018 RepID=A0A9P7G4Z8_9AGAR|nr:hypothetical protein DXG03_001350 [Asterophora parasitica]
MGHCTEASISYGFILKEVELRKLLAALGQKSEEDDLNAFKSLRGWTSLAKCDIAPYRFTGDAKRSNEAMDFPEACEGSEVPPWGNTQWQTPGQPQQSQQQQQPQQLQAPAPQPTWANFNQILQGFNAMGETL